ncbi:alpha/beta hydrolase-fold protein [Lonepinella sp. BR2919]|uniref:carboxylesterase family protein n=1 Tax=unclassified Lonepinella TaxID=2642006 RepID=UPI003F6E3BC9
MKKILSLMLISTLMSACNANTQSARNAVGGPQLGSVSNSASPYGGADKSYDTTLPVLREQIAPRFQVLKFTDEATGKTLEYNLYTPKNYNPKKSYPLVMFIADASTAGKGTAAPLKQGYGGIIWATDESQAKNPAFVLVPAFSGVAVNDAWQHTDEVDLVIPLIKQLTKTYAIDQNRLYTTGQSMGGMISLYLNSLYPDFFAASMFVGSKWDINSLEPLKNNKFLYVTAAGDKATETAQGVGAILAKANVPYGEVEFSAKLPQAEQDSQVAALLAKGNKANFIRFSKGTVLPTGVDGIKGASEHMYSFDYAYLLTPAREWLFEQHK